MTYRLTFELQGLPPLQTAAATTHHREARRVSQAWKQLVVDRVGLGKGPEKPLKRARVVFTRFSTTCPDPANQPAAMKPLEDGLVAAGVLEDDNEVVYGRCSACGRAGAVYRWVKEKRGRGRVRIEVWEMAPLAMGQEGTDEG